MVLTPQNVAYVISKLSTCREMLLMRALGEARSVHGLEKAVLVLVLPAGNSPVSSGVIPATMGSGTDGALVVSTLTLDFFKSARCVFASSLTLD